jgi:hypothetical protein
MKGLWGAKVYEGDNGYSIRKGAISAENEI